MMNKTSESFKAIKVFIFPQFSFYEELRQKHFGDKSLILMGPDDNYTEFHHHRNFIFSSLLLNRKNFCV